MTKEEAIKKLKEAKELRDLEVISSDEYNSLLKKYKPLLLDEESSDNTIPSNIQLMYQKNTNQLLITI